jgi:hypothetical protein
VPNECAWQALLQSWKVTNTRHVRIVTEGALLASVLSHGIRLDLAVVLPRTLADGFVVQDNDGHRRVRRSAHAT